MINATGGYWIILRHSFPELLQRLPRFSSCLSRPEVSQYRCSFRLFTLQHTVLRLLPFRCRFICIDFKQDSGHVVPSSIRIVASDFFPVLLYIRYSKKKKERKRKGIKNDDSIDRRQFSLRSFYIAGFRMKDED